MRDETFFVDLTSWIHRIMLVITMDIVTLAHDTVHVDGHAKDI
jgi:hypothetical protein